MTAVTYNEAFVPENIRFRTFPVVRKGYDTDAVGKFLFDLATHVADRDKREAGLKAAAEQAWQKVRELENGAPAIASDGQDEVAPMPPQAMLVVTNAQQQADRIVEAAEQRARDILNDARRRASAIWAQAENALQDKILDVHEVGIYGGQSANLAANVREQAERLDTAKKALKVARQHLNNQLEDLEVAVHHAKALLVDDEDDEDD